MKSKNIKQKINYENNKSNLPANILKWQLIKSPEYSTSKNNADDSSSLTSKGSFYKHICLVFNLDKLNESI